MQLTFDRSLYLPEAVDAAAAAYAEYARITVTSSDAAVTAEIADVQDFEPQVVAHAFCNHVLHETIARRRQAAVPEAG